MVCELDLTVPSQKSKKKKISNTLACLSILMQSNAQQLVRHCQVFTKKKKNLSQSFVELTDGVCFHNNILDKVTAQLISLRYNASENIKARQNASSLDSHM